MNTNKVTEVGIFRSDAGFDKKQLPVMESLTGFYTPDVLKTVLLPIILHTGKKERSISLRALDWLVTNYCKKHPIMYVLKTEGAERVVNMYSEYKSWLAKYRRTHFDPFRRKHKLSFTLDDVTYHTTVGQLNFMFWASRYGVIDYAKEHIKTIEKDHAVTMKSKQADKSPSVKKKRRQLSHAPARKVMVLSSSISVGFQPHDTI